MMKLHGTISALITPFDKSGAVDYGKLKALVDFMKDFEKKNG